MNAKKGLAKLTVLFLVLGLLSGCGKGAKPSNPDEGSQNGTTTNGTTTNNSTTAEEKGNFNATGLPILNEPEEFTFMVMQQSTTHPAENKPIVKETEEATNIKINWIEVPQSSWKEKTNIAFASGDLPDVFASGGIDTALHYEQFLILDDLIEQYAPNVQKILEDPRYAQGLKAPDGKIHQLPGGDEAFNNQMDKTLWINQAWLDTLGLKMPTTTDEFYDVLKAFKEKDPNGNGKADEIPLTFQGITTWATGMSNLFGPFGVLETGSHVFMDGDKVVFAAREQGYYDALQWMHKLFKEGLIDQEAFSHSAEQYGSKAKGKDIIGATVNWRPDVTVGPELGDNYTHVVPLKGPEGKQMVSLNNIVRTSGFGITTACKNPEALIRWYDYINSSMEMTLKWSRGVENEHWKKVEGDKFMFTPENRPADVNAGEWKNNFTFGGQSPSLWTITMEDRIVPNPNSPKDIKKAAITESLPYAIPGLPAGSDTPENTERKSMLSADIDTYITKFIATSVINGIDEQKWEAHLKALKDLRVDEYVEISQEYVDRLAK
ncbi:MAG: extracellular solute-binding protein [Epulopiscium sp.]|nr:extracellular solute-binding protein [Candidatus Epulonipiscium sp.]